MGRMRIHGELDVSSAFAEGIDKLLGLLDGDNIVKRAMKSPNRSVLQSFYSLWKAVEDYSSTADWGNGGKTFRPKRAQVPGAVSTHAQAGQIEPLMIDGKNRSAVKKELIEPIRQLRPPCVPRTCGRNDDKGTIGMLCHVRRKPVSQDSGGILPDFHQALQERMVCGLPRRCFHSAGAMALVPLACRALCADVAQTDKPDLSAKLCGTG